MSGPHVLRPDDLAPVSITDVDGWRLLTLTRPLPGSLERVWQLLVSRDELARWAPFTADRSLERAGPVTVTMLDGVKEPDIPATVILVRAPGAAAADEVGSASLPPRRFSRIPNDLTEPFALEPEPMAELQLGLADDIVEWSLIDDVADEQRTWVTLRHWLATAEQAAGVAAGWHLCLQVAAAIAADRPIPPIRGRAARAQGWDDLNLLYADALGIAPTAAPLNETRSAEGG